MVGVLARDTEGRWFDFRPFHFQVTNLGQVVHTHVPVTEQYNLVPVKGR